MVWIYLAVSEESQKHSKATLSPSLTVKGIDTAKPYSYHEWLKENSLLLRSGMTLQPSDQPSSQKSISSTEDSPVKTSQLPALVKAWEESAQSFFERSSDSVAKYDRDSYSWKTYQISLIEEGWYPLRENLPTCGMTVDGEFYRLDEWEPTTYAEGSGYLPTPMSSDGLRWLKVAKRNVQESIAHCLKRGGTDNTIYRFLWLSLGAKQAAEYIEWMMGYQKNSTVLEPWAIPLIHELQDKHLKD